MRLEWIFLLALAGLGYCNTEYEIDCTKAVKCSTQCKPICAGNDTRSETFINSCIYRTEYCNRNLKASYYEIKDSEHGCPINCDIMRNCANTKDTVCVKNPSGSFNKSFTNECYFDTDYCNQYKQTLGLDYCIYKQNC